MNIDELGSILSNPWRTDNPDVPEDSPWHQASAIPSAAVRYVQQWVPFIVLVLGCVLTATAVTTIATRQEVATANAFRADTLAVQRVTQVQLDTVVGGDTRFGSAPVGESRNQFPGVPRVRLRAAAARRYVGVDGIGFAPRVSAGSLRTFIRSMSLDGIAKLKVRPEGNRTDTFRPCCSSRATTRIEHDRVRFRPPSASSSMR